MRRSGVRIPVAPPHKRRTPVRCPPLSSSPGCLVRASGLCGRRDRASLDPAGPLGSRASGASSRPWTCRRPAGGAVPSRCEVRFFGDSRGRPEVGAGENGGLPPVVGTAPQPIGAVRGKKRTSHREASARDRGAVVTGLRWSMSHACWSATAARSSGAAGSWGSLSAGPAIFLPRSRATSDTPSACWSGNRATSRTVPQEEDRSVTTVAGRAKGDTHVRCPEHH